MAWGFIQSNSSTNNTSGASSLAVTYLSNVSSGTKLICAVQASGGGSTAISTSSVKDGAGNSFTKILSAANGGNLVAGEMSFWAIDTPAGDVGTTPQITANFSTPEFGCSMLVQEVSGLAVGNTLAAMIDGTGATLTGSSGASTGSPAYSSTAINEYLVALYGDDGQSTITWTAPAGYNTDPKSINSSGAGDIGVAYKNSTGGSETGSWGRTNSTSQWSAGLVAFQLAASVVVTVVTTLPAITLSGGARSVVSGGGMMQQ
jgi:hypothetical protein